MALCRRSRLGSPGGPDESKWCRLGTRVAAMQRNLTYHPNVRVIPMRDGGRPQEEGKSPSGVFGRGDFLIGGG